MAEYIDSSNNIKTDFIRDWLEKNLVSGVKSFRVQSGYFGYNAIESFTNVLNLISTNGEGVIFVLGSNKGSLSAKDALKVFQIVAKNKGSSLTIVAFQNAEFHPKCYYIKRGDSSETVVVGSGNLTPAGTSLNTEAAIVLDSSKGDNISLIHEIKNAIDKWTITNQNGGYQINSKSDIEILRQNKIIDLRTAEVRTPRGKIAKQNKIKTKVKKSLKGFWKFSKTSGKKGQKTHTTLDVLIAEIPNAGTRWKQANFDRDNFENFFGLVVGNKLKNIKLQSVDSKGNIGPSESRQGVSVKSQNYRIELGAASDLSYPSSSPPIGVFVRLGAKHFRYILIMPNKPHYKTIATFLANSWAGSPHRKRRILTNTKILRKVWKKSPLWTKAGTLF